MSDSTEQFISFGVVRRAPSAIFSMRSGLTCFGSTAARVPFCASKKFFTFPMPASFATIFDVARSSAREVVGFAAMADSSFNGDRPVGQGNGVDAGAVARPLAGAQALGIDAQVFAVLGAALLDTQLVQHRGAGGVWPLGFHADEDEGQHRFAAGGCIAVAVVSRLDVVALPGHLPGEVGGAGV